MLRDMSAHRALAALRPDSRFDRDLGLDSLSRVELATRIDEEFGVSLPDSVIVGIETPEGLARAIAGAGRGAFGPRPAAPASISAGGGVPRDALTLNEVLLWRATAAPDGAHVLLRLEDDSEETITYGALLAGASKVAAALIEKGLAPLETVVLMLPTGGEFFFSFFGVLLAGGIPVPIYPPFRADRVEDYARRQAGILRNAGARFMITFAAARPLARLMSAHVPDLRHVCYCAELLSADAPSVTMAVDPGQSALIQYTSGSTGRPKGVVLSHANLLANIRALGEAAGISPRDVVVSWLPLYHDMGLIGAWLASLYYGIPVAIMSPLAFLTRPERWLLSIHFHRATVTAAPNFAYELCARRVSDRAIEGLDLSCLRLAFNGAEPVSPDTMERFNRRFVPYGFKPEAMFPVYGMAENSLCLTTPVPGEAPEVDVVSRLAFGESRRAVKAEEGEAHPLRFVSCGRPIPGHEMRLVGGKGEDINEDRVEGLVQFRGPSSTKGYYRSPEATGDLLSGDWLNAGDLAYRAAGRYFITGRRKDIIIRGGRNLVPQEIEEIAGDVQGVRKGCVAAFGVADSDAGTERIVIVAETREGKPAARKEIADAVVAAVFDAVGIPPDEVLMAGPGTVPKTSSGKIRRADCKASYTAGGGRAFRSSAAAQFARVAFRSFLSRFAAWGDAGARAVFTLYAGLWLLLTLPPFWLAAALAPSSPAGRLLVRRLTGIWSKIILLLSFSPVRVRHAAEEDRNAGPRIFVSNHCSFLDTPVLAAILPADFVFVAKSELLGVPPIGTFLGKGGHLMVDRKDPSRARVADEIVAALRAGTSVLIFPEATFARAPGVRPFSMGAFDAAVRTKLPLVPVAIRGTRRMLRDGQWLPRPGRPVVFITEALAAGGDGWDEAVRLRALARERIAAAAGEPLLDITEVGRIQRE